MLNRLQEVFASFQKHDVKYVVIGGVAAVLYGVPRATFDLDILIEAGLGIGHLRGFFLDSRIVIPFSRF